MHKAFWDSLESKLEEDPPNYSHAIVLIKEVKEVGWCLLFQLIQNTITIFQELFVAVTMGIKALKSHILYYVTYMSLICQTDTLVLRNDRIQQ